MNNQLRRGFTSRIYRSQITVTRSLHSSCRVIVGLAFQIDHGLPRGNLTWEISPASR